MAACIENLCVSRLLYTQDMPIRVLYDGWPLIYQPDGPAALHLGTLLSLVPKEIETLLALPVESSPEGFLPDVELAHLPSRNLNDWQQKQLQRLATEKSADLIHSSLPAASLFGRTPVLISPSGFGALEPAEASMRARLGQALGRGGLARASQLYPKDIPAESLPGKRLALAPVVNPAFTSAKAGPPPEDLELPESYILYHGPSHPGTMLKLLESWTWAAASIGELYPLVLLGLSEGAKRFVEEQLPDLQLEEHVVLLPRVHPAHVAAIYQGASALAHPAPLSTWGDPVRHALAVGKPVVALKDERSEALVNGAAYLVETGDLRAFGAAMITVVVDEVVRDKLVEEAGKLSAGWDSRAFQIDLLEVYEGSV